MRLQRPFPRAVNRILLNVLLDGALAAVATPVARYIADPDGGLLHPLWFIAGGAITLLLAGLPFRMPQQYWRFAGIEDLLGVVGGSIASAILFALLLVGAGFPLPTRTFPIVHALTLIVALGTPRVVYRLRRGRARGTDNGAQSVLLAGAGENADVFLRALDTREGRGSFRVVGLLSLGPGSVGRRIHGRTIFGSIVRTGVVLARLRQEGRPVSAIVVTDPGLQGEALADLVAQAEAEGVAVRRMPAPTQLLATPADEAVQLAPVAIEELLNRPQVPLDREGMARLVRGRRVLVTGAGGTIGSELARQVAALGPSHLVLLDNGEYALWQIDTELAETQPDVTRQICLADIRDEGRIRSVCEEVRPELVFHAAALKHVPMVEANPLEGLMTNAVGTRIVADAARAAGASCMVFISTDKAVNPSGVMGASKRLAEMYVQGLDVAARRGGGMRCVTVRFGNVLGSTGSVVPLFRRQLERGGPLTVTHPDMQRYFMTVREAVGLVLQASVVGAETDFGKQGGIFVLDMGKPVRIVDLARQMIRLAGLRVAEGATAGPGAIPIAFTGLRPGEKLFEELFHGKEPPAPTGYAGLLMATPRTADPAIVGRSLDEIAAACRAGHIETALSVLGRMVPEFEPRRAEALAGG
ncbi:MAG TPA: nucleoside-diphosphate sugar epimerase/dehydratase [Acetobacteraceae bacterium]|nr:nucleoside-diphosphate sugar epimerase/dehydratase [Acetobacteraceae bacterium]